MAESEPFQVLFYDRPDGKEPAKEFLLSLDKKMRAKMLQAQVGSDISRVLYFFFIGRKIILTNGFIKKTQKTPAADIERAKQYRAEFLRREEAP